MKEQCQSTKQDKLNDVDAVKQYKIQEHSIKVQQTRVRIRVCMGQDLQREDNFHVQKNKNQKMES